MNNFDDLTRIAKVVNSLERKGLFAEVDKLSNILTRLAQNDPGTDYPDTDPTTESAEPAETSIPDEMSDKEISDAEMPDDESQMDTEISKALELYNDFEKFGSLILPTSFDNPSNFVNLSKDNLDKLKLKAEAVKPYLKYLSSEHAEQINGSIPLIDSLLTNIFGTKSPAATDNTQAPGTL